MRSLRPCVVLALSVALGISASQAGVMFDGMECELDRDSFANVRFEASHDGGSVEASATLFYANVGSLIASVEIYTARLVNLPALVVDFVEP